MADKLNLNALSDVVKEQVIHVMIDPDQIDRDCDTVKIVIEAVNGRRRVLRFTHGELVNGTRERPARSEDRRRMGRVVPGRVTDASDQPGFGYA